MLLELLHVRQLSILQQCGALT